MKSPYKLGLFVLSNIVEEVRTIFEEKNDATIHIPTFYPTDSFTIS